MKISVLNAGQQTDYLYGFVSGLSAIPSLEIEVVDSDSSIGVMECLPNTTLYNLRGNNTAEESLQTKTLHIGRYYLRLLSYAAQTKSEIFHIQWENSIALMDRMVLPLYYKLLGKKLVHTAHNIDKDARDGRSNFFRRLSLGIMYRTMDRIIVHTSKMKVDLCSQFHVVPEKVAVIPHGLNNRIPRRGISQEAARKKLGIKPDAHAILFFGQIDKYKGVEYLIDAAAALSHDDPAVVLMIAGKPKRRTNYAAQLKLQAANLLSENHVLLRMEFIPADEVETYFAAADCLVLPYTMIYQSGVIFLAYRFGLPIIATDIGSFREDVLEGETGFICKPGDVHDMTAKLQLFFNSHLFRQRIRTRTQISEYAEHKYSWSDIGRQTFAVYASLVKKS
ncbi:MAG: glycosyltransferase [Ignavibacteriae bacterium]|nr:MAG: glycosyltransferase [Ignavibacteriota bacterium]